MTAKTAQKKATTPARSGSVISQPAPAPSPAAATRPGWLGVSAAFASITPTQPRMRQLIGVCGWAAVLGGIGLAVGLRGMFAVLTHRSPGWFEPIFVIVGLGGVGLTVGAFLTVHRAREPWIMLGLASAALVSVMLLTSFVL